jgi:hypothetical protein
MPNNSRNPHNAVILSEAKNPSTVRVQRAAQSSYEGAGRSILSPLLTKGRAGWPIQARCWLEWGSFLAWTRIMPNNSRNPHNAVILSEAKNPSTVRVQRAAQSSYEGAGRSISPLLTKGRWPIQARCWLEWGSFFAWTRIMPVGRRYPPLTKLSTRPCRNSCVPAAA